jgi:hypothetical protein
MAVSTQQQIQIPFSWLSARNVKTGDRLNINQQVFGGKTVTRVYRVMTVDRVNEIASCVLVSETEFKA